MMTSQSSHTAAAVKNKGTYVLYCTQSKTNPTSVMRKGVAGPFNMMFLRSSLLFLFDSNSSTIVDESGDEK